MKVIAITQARVGSTRLPAKVLKEVGGKTLLELHLQRVSQSQLIEKLIVATTTEPDAHRIAEIAARVNASVYHGSIDDVLDRYYQAAKKYNPDYVVRITSDCPLLDAKLIDKIIRFAQDQQVDYVSNTLEATFPDGQDIEVFRFAALEKAWKEANLKSEREHVTSYIWKNSTWFGQTLFTSDCFRNPINFSDVRMTVDAPNDLETVIALIEAIGINAEWEVYANYYQSNVISMCNSNISRNEGYYKSLSGDN